MTAIVYRNPIDLGQRALIAALLDPQAADPPSPNAGQVWFNTTAGKFKGYDGTSVRVLLDSGRVVDSDIAAGAAIALAKLATDPLARANHTGTQLAATISDFAAAVRSNRLDQLAAPTADVPFGGRKITGLADGAAATDGATVGQMLAAITAKDYKDSVRVATTANVNLAAPGANVDGVAMGAGDRFLAAGQSTASQNGIYVYNGSAAAATRATDSDQNAEVTNGLSVRVTAGTHAGAEFLLTTADPVTVGTTPLTFSENPAAAALIAGTGLQIVGSTVSLVTPVTVANGGTGAVTAPAALTALGAAKVATVRVTGDGATTDLAVAHNLGSKNHTAQVWKVSDDTNPLVAMVRGVNSDTLKFTPAALNGEQFDVVCSAAA